MKKRRIIALLIMVNMLAVMMPNLPITGYAANKVTYHRKNPEVAILNRNTGNSAKFYETLISNNSPYNAIKLFGKNSSDKISNTTIEYSNFPTSTLFDVSLAYDNLKANASGTFHNNWHKHSAGFWGLGSQKVLAFSGLEFLVKGQYMRPIRYGVQRSNESNARLGNGEFTTISTSETLTYMKMNFTQSSVAYDEGKKTCNCGGHYVEKTVVSFKDERAPQIVRLGGSIANKGFNNSNFKAGDEITVEITYDEPIRFADDSENHDDLYVGLVISGKDSTTYPRAKLNKLDDSTLYFSYTVQSSDGVQTITGLDLSHLFGNKLPLKQVSENSSFNVSLPSDVGGNTEGFSTTSSYITDLAGNPIAERNAPVRAYIDTQAPFGVKIMPKLFTKNNDVKVALGKTDPTSPEYLDASDTHLGFWDYAFFYLTLNEVVKIPELDPIYKPNVSYKNIIAHTNLVTGAEEVPVVLKSSTAYTAAVGEQQYGLGASDGQATYFSFDTLTISSPSTKCKDPDGKLKITNITFEDGTPFTDLAGNPMTVLDTSDLMKSDCFIDTDVPKVQTSASSNIVGDNTIYTVTPEGDGFRFPYTISDESDVNGLPAKFRWVKGFESTPFEYVITSEAELKSDEKWKEGTMNVTYPFTQISAQQFLHIRPIAGKTYNLYDTMLEFYPSDYAGNTAGIPGLKPKVFQLDVFWEDTPPTAVAGKVDRKINDSTTATISVDVALSEQSFLKEAFYLWNDGTTTPSDNDSGWEAAVGAVLNKKTANVIASSTVMLDTNFAKHLWVKVKDISDNVLIKDLGEFKYTLAAIPYSLGYTNAITSKASITADKMVDGSRLVFMVPVPDGEAGEYFVRTYGSEITSKIDEVRDVFRHYSTSYFESKWTRMIVTETGGNYDFKVSSNTDMTYMNNITNNNIVDGALFSGTLHVTVLSGLGEAYVFDKDNCPIKAGTSINTVTSENITLRVSSANMTAPNAFDNVSIEPNQIIDAKQDFAVSGWDPETKVLSTAEGLSFSIHLGKDLNGWNYEDIDFAKSYISLELFSEGVVSKTFQIPLGYGAEQTVVVPKDDYPSGSYIVRLFIECKAGKDISKSIFKEGTNQLKLMFIDNTKASNDFGITAVSYIPNQSLDNYYHHGIKEKNYYTDDDVIFLPTNDLNTFKNSNSLDVNVRDIVPKDYLGGYATRVWNVTIGQTVKDSKYVLGHGSTGGDIQRFPITVWGTNEEALNENYGRDIRLVKNKDNVIAVQVSNGNGNESDIRYYTIRPLENHLAGVITATRDENGGNVVAGGNLIFKPVEGQSMNGVRVYCSTVEYSGTTKIDNREMDAQADGSYTSPLFDGKNTYYVYTVDQYGNLSLIDAYVGNQVNVSGLYNAVVDKKAPVVTSISNRSENGLYQAKFKIEDDTLFAYKPEESGSPRSLMPMKLNMKFDQARAQWLGITENTNLELTVNKDDEFKWKAEGISETGIYEVSAYRTSAPGANEWDPHWLEVTVKGVVGYKDGADAQNFTLSMDATDALGNIGNGDSKLSGVSNVKPAAYTYGGSAPFYNGYSYDKSLMLTFNVPVLPEASWLCPNPKMGLIQNDGFPIYDDGTWDISYTDIFGKLYTQTIELNDVFGKYGLSISIDPMELTGDNVNFTGKNLDKDPEGALLLWKKNGNELTIVASSDLTHNTPLREKIAKLKENGDYVLIRYDEVYTYDQLYNQGYYNRGDLLPITISNIGKAAPEAEPIFYFEATGTEYTSSTVPTGDTQGNVEVRYKTSRHVTPTNGTNEVFTFKYNGVTNHTFKYVDDLGNAGELAIDLNTYGIKLAAPPEPPNDENAPNVVTDIYAKRSGTYKQTESFGDWSTEEEIKNTFVATNFVQGYSMTIRATDESSYKIVALKNAPSSITYATAKSDTIDGVTIMGNNITVNKATDFFITVVDNANAETIAEKDNFTTIAIKAADMEKWFDTTPPTATTKSVASGLYEKTVYALLADKSNNGTDTVNVILNSPKLEKIVGGTYDGWYKRVFANNSTDHLVFNDIAGNQGSSSIQVTDIDETKPVLITSWTPPLITGTPPTADQTNPPAGPVNTAVTAVVSSSASITSVTAEYSVDNINWTSSQVPGVNFLKSSENVTVTFNDDKIGIRLTITAPNGKTSVQTLFLPDGVIDMTPPVISQTKQDQIRSGFTVPYATRVTLTPNEPSYCLNAGTTGEVYDSTNPLVLTVTENKDTSYIFNDKAGNRADITVTTTGIDRTAPIIKTTPENTMKLKMVDGAISVDVIADEASKAECNGKNYNLQANVAQKLNFTDNGVYLVTVKDGAGNTSTTVIAIGNIDKTAPMISFDKLTLNIRQNSLVDSLKALLNAGVTVWDNITSTADIVWNYVETNVDLSQPGLYEAIYTVTDNAGNNTITPRYVRVFDKNLPGVNVDDNITEPDGTTVIPVGEHTLHISNLKAIAPGVMEPYKLKIRKGLYTEGQIKYFSSTVAVGTDGKFTINEEGFYTIYIETQSRQSYRTLLYVER